MEIACALYEVGIEFLNIVSMNFRLRRLNILITGQEMTAFINAGRCS
jgi:hypothetical protein